MSNVAKNLITFMSRHNTYSYQVTSIYDQQFYTGAFKDTEWIYDSGALDYSGT